MNIKQQHLEVDHNGQTIRGMVYRPETDGANQRVPTVLFLHGFTGQRTEHAFLFVRLARLLAQRGIAAVTFDFINSGESDGSFDQMLVTQELADAMRMTEWVQRQPFVDRTRMSLLGFSLGGLLACCVSGRTDVFQSLVLIAPTTEQNMTRHASRECEEDACSAIYGPHCLHPKLFEDVATLDAVSDSVKNPRPTLLVQGTDDKSVPPAVSQIFADRMKQSGVPLEHHLIEGADHGFNRRALRENLLEKVVMWLADRA